MNKSDYMTYRMIVCSDCKKNKCNEIINYICRGNDYEIDECLDATWETTDY